MAREAVEEPARSVGLLGATSLVIGSVVGSGIFLAPPLVAALVPSPGLVVLVWVLGGALSLLAALTLAELGSMFPRAGGQYVFLREAFGDATGFLFGWMALAVNYSGTVAAVAVALATALGSLAGFGGPYLKPVAVAFIWTLTAVNLIGLRYANGVQVASTLAKVVALAALVLFGLALGSGPDSPFLSLAEEGFPAGGIVAALGLALVPALFAFDGMASATFVGGEVRDPARTIPRATILAALAVTALYVVVNLAFLWVLPMDDLAGNEAAAFDAGRVLAGAAGAVLLAAAVAIATFGTLNGYVWQSPRIYYAMARDGLLYGSFGRLGRRGTPVFGLVLQAEWSSLLVLSGTFSQLITYVSMTSWLFLAVTGLALFRLRRKRPDLRPAYRTWGYPIVPTLFVASALWVVTNSLVYDTKNSAIGLGLALTGVPVYAFVRWRRARSPNTAE